MSRESNNETKIIIAKLMTMISECKSKDKLDTWLCENYDFRPVTRYSYIKRAYQMLAENAEDEIRTARGVQIKRIQDLLDNALQTNDKSTAIKLLDMLNRIYSLYVDRQEVKVSSDEIKFKFGDEITNEK